MLAKGFSRPCAAKLDVIGARLVGDGHRGGGFAVARGAVEHAKPGQAVLTVDKLRHRRIGQRNIGDFGYFHLKSTPLNQLTPLKQACLTPCAAAAAHISFAF